MVLLTGHGSIDEAVAAMKDGAYDFLTKPPHIGRLLRVIARAAERQAMVWDRQVREATHPDFSAPALAVMRRYR